MEQPICCQGAGVRPAPEACPAGGDGDLRKRVVDSLIAAVELVNLKDLRDTAPIQTMLSRGFEGYFAGNAVDLSMMHELLLAQRRISRKDIARICVVYSVARDFHKFEVKLPREVKERPDLPSMVIAAGELLFDRESYRRRLAEVSSRSPAEPLFLAPDWLPPKAAIIGVSALLSMGVAAVLSLYLF